MLRIKLIIKYCVSCWITDILQNDTRYIQYYEGEGRMLLHGDRNILLLLCSQITPVKPSAFVSFLIYFMHLINGRNMERILKPVFLRHPVLNQTNPICTVLSNFHNFHWILDEPRGYHLHQLARTFCGYVSPSKLHRHDVPVS